MDTLKGMIIELGDDEYYVIDEIHFKEKKYLYLSKLCPKGSDGLEFVEYREGKVFPIEDEYTLKNLYLLVSKEYLKSSK